MSVLDRQYVIEVGDFIASEIESHVTGIVIQIGTVISYPAFLIKCGNEELRVILEDDASLISKTTAWWNAYAAEIATGATP